MTVELSNRILFMKLKKIKLNRSGFTLVEMLVSISIVSLMSGLFIANYKYSNYQAALTSTIQKTTSDLRLTQSYSLGAQEFGGSIPGGGWGVRFNTGTPTGYIIYADLNGNHAYDSGELLKNVDFPANVRLDSTNKGAVLNICFQPPDPTTYLNGTVNDPIPAVVTLKEINSQKTRTIIINFIGLIDAN